MDNSFIRTESGLKNEHLFHDVDYVVYLEGGSKSLTLTQVIDEDIYNDNTLDIAFWSNLFARYLPDKQLKYKSTGSKTVLQEIANVIRDKNIQSVLICMDSEFDELLQKRINDKRIFYTYGYSWENESWSKTTVINVISEITALIPDMAFSQIYTSFIDSNEIGVKADFLLFKQNNSFWDKKARLKYIDKRKNGCFVKIDEMLSDIHNKGISDDMLDRVSIDVPKFCFGHLIADGLCFAIRKYLDSKRILITVNNDCLNRIVIKEHYRNYDTNQILVDYYEKQFARLLS